MFCWAFIVIGVVLWFPPLFHQSIATTHSKQDCTFTLWEYVPLDVLNAVDLFALYSLNQDKCHAHSRSASHIS